MYVVTALPTGPHAASASEETVAAADTPAAPDAALAANGGAAASADGVGATPAGGEPAPAGSDFGDVLQREQQGGAPTGSSAATPAHGRVARHHDARHDDAGSPAAVPTPGVPLSVPLATGPTTPLGALALQPRGKGDDAADHAKIGDDQGAAAGRLGSGPERGYAASGTGTAWSPERTVTLSTRTESQPQMPVVGADALAAGAPHPMGQPHEGSAPAKGHLSLAPAQPVVAGLDAAPAVATLRGAAASAPAHAADTQAATPPAPATAVAASDAPAHDRTAGAVQTGEQLDAAIAAAVADLATATDTKLPAGTVPVATSRLARGHASNGGQTQGRDAVPSSVPTMGSDAAQPHGAQAAGSQPQTMLPHASAQATHAAAGEATAHTDSAGGIRHNDAAAHAEVAPLLDGRVTSGHNQGQQGAPAVATLAGLTAAALPVGDTAALIDRAVSLAPGERSAPAQHGASNVGRHDGAPAVQGVPTGSTAALQTQTLPGITTPTGVPGGRLPAASVRASGVETGLHCAAGGASGAGIDSSIMPLRPHTAAPSASGSAAFALSQAMPAATGTAPAHHAAPKETTVSSGVLAPVAEGIFVRLGSLRTTPSSSSFHVVLQPQALGTVSVHVQRGQDGLQVTLIPQQSATREILDRHMHELVSALGAADGTAPRVSVVAPGAASAGSFSGADQGMPGSGAFSADSGGQQPFQGQGAQGEPSSWDDAARPPVIPAPVRAPAPSRAPLAAQRSGNASRVDFQA